MPARPSVKGEHEGAGLTTMKHWQIDEVAWDRFDRVAAAAPEALRKGPRGGGRDTSKIVDHVMDADRAYANQIGIKVAGFASDDRAAVAAMRDAMLAVLHAARSGEPLAGRRWPARYAAHRIAWHALDHAWEIEDRSAPEPEAT